MKSRKKKMSLGAYGNAKSLHVAANSACVFKLPSMASLVMTARTTPIKDKESVQVSNRKGRP